MESEFLGVWREPQIWALISRTSKIGARDDMANIITHICCTYVTFVATKSAQEIPAQTFLAMKSVNRAKPNLSAYFNSAKINEKLFSIDDMANMIMHGCCIYAHLRRCKI